MSTSQQKSKVPPWMTLGMILAGILFPLMVIEILAYLAPGVIPSEIKSVFQNEEDQPLKGLAPDEDLGYKYAPDLESYPVPFDGEESEEIYTVSTVTLGYPAIGFRDDGLDGEPFAVVIGDSYASCASVEMEACWVELLEQEMDRDFANLGVVGYAPQQEQRMLAKYGLPLAPELVLWVFFANDLDDAWRFEQFGTGAVREGEFWQNPVKSWLARHSTIYTIWSFFWFNRHLFLNLARADGETVPRDSNLIWWLTHTDLTIPEVAEGFVLTQTTILEADEAAAGEGKAFVVVIIPFREQVYAPEQLRPRLDGLNEALIDFGQQHDIPVIDLTPVLREAAAGGSPPLYFSKDIHLNARGNGLVAESLASELKDY